MSRRRGTSSPATEASSASVGVAGMSPLGDFGQLLDSIDVDERFFSAGGGVRDEFLAIYNIEYLAEYKPTLSRREKNDGQAAAFFEKAEKARGSRDLPGFLDLCKKALRYSSHTSVILEKVLTLRGHALMDKTDLDGEFEELLRLFGDTCDGVLRSATQLEHHQPYHVGFNATQLACAAQQTASCLREAGSDGEVEIRMKKTKEETMEEEESRRSDRTRDGGGKANEAASAPAAAMDRNMSPVQILQKLDVVGRNAEFVSKGRSVDAGVGNKSAWATPSEDTVSDGIQVNHSPAKGVGYVANRYIRPGELLLTERPISHILIPEHWGFRCDFCYKNVSLGLPCHHCANVIYCDADCRTNAAATHLPYECPIMDNLEELYIYNGAALAYRMVARTSLEDIVRQEGAPFSRVDPEDVCIPWTVGVSDFVSGWRSTFNFVSNRKSKNPQTALRSAKLAVYMVKLLEGVGYFHQEVSHMREGAADPRAVVGELLYNWLLSFPSNCFTTSEITATQDEEGRLKIMDPTVGEAVFSRASIFNHSCYPNATQYFLHGGKQIVVRAHRPILPGDEVTISYGCYAYCDTEEDRKLKLRNDYHFDCSCVACGKRWKPLGPSTDVPLTVGTVSDDDDDGATDSVVPSRTQSSVDNVACADAGGGNDGEQVEHGDSLPMWPSDAEGDQAANCCVVSSSSSSSSVSFLDGDETKRKEDEVVTSMTDHECEICRPYAEILRKGVLDLDGIVEASSRAVSLVEELECRHVQACRERRDAAKAEGKKSEDKFDDGGPSQCMYKSQFHLTTCFLLRELAHGPTYA